MYKNSQLYISNGGLVCRVRCFFNDEYLKEWWNTHVKRGNVSFIYYLQNPFKILIREGDLLLRNYLFPKHEYKDITDESIPRQLLAYPTYELYKIISKKSSCIPKYVEWCEDGSVFNTRTGENYPPKRKKYIGRLCIKIPEWAL